MPLRIVIFTPWFFPNLGGVETVTDLLACGLCAEGCDVTVITTYPANGGERARPYRLHRKPTIASSWREVRDTDVVLMFGPSLRFIGIPLLLRKPLVVNHYTWMTWRERPLISLTQRLLCLAARNVTPSRMMAPHFGRRTRMLPNPYDDRVFRPYPEVPRDSELVFLGRMVAEKGVHLLLDALRLLHDRGLTLQLTLVGQGPEESALRARAAQLGIAEALRWRGPLSGVPLAQELARHRVLVVPSLWREPFGIVAVEGAACGCRVVVSSHGGLLEAAGPAGYPFTAGDAASLADAIARAWIDPPAPTSTLSEHLSHYAARGACREHLRFLSSVLAPE